MSNIVYDTTYDALIDTLADYYGTTSIGWQEITDAGFTDGNIINAINDIPGYHAVANADGSVRMIVESKTYGSQSYANSVASGVNSNAQVGTNSAGNVVTVQAPANTQINQQTGTIEVAKNVNNMTTTQFMVKEVLPAIAAAGTGIALGTTIDRALYNSNPDFFNNNNMWALDPSTWNSITSGMDDSAGEVVLGTAFNMLFGIAPDTGNVQAYIDENAFAYFAQYLYEQGAFTNSYGWDGVSPSDWGLYQPIEISSNVMTVTDQQGNTYSAYLVGTCHLTSYEPPKGVTVAYRVNGGDNLRVTVCAKDGGNSFDAIIASTSPFSAGLSYVDSSGIVIGGESMHTASQYTYNGQTVYYIPLVQSSSINVSGFAGVNNCDDRNIVNHSANTAWVMEYGNFTQSSEVEGIGVQDGAILPNLDGLTSLADILNALKQQYPDIFNNPITNDVIQNDGTIKQYKYVPIPLPNVTSAQDVKPTSDTDAQNQTKTDYDPANDPYNIWENIFEPTVNPWIPDYTDTDDGSDDGGDGDTPTPVPPVGTASALWRIYNPSQAQLDAFGAWLWSSDFVDQLLKLFNDPMQAIIGLHKIFVTPPVSGSGAIKVGYLVSTANANYVSGQYVTVDCGTVNLQEYFGNVFDYSPFTQLRLFLPFIGIIELDTADCMRGKISVIYHVDVLTGACLAEVKVIRDSAGGILYTYSGNCAVQYPVSSGSYVGIVTGLLGITAGVAGTVASGGALAPALIGAGAGLGMMHTNVKHSGAISGNAGAMGLKKPYLIIERPITRTPENLANIEGLPQNKLVTIGSLSGFVKVKECHVDGIPATQKELEEIKGYLTNGFYIS